MKKSKDIVLVGQYSLLSQPIQQLVHRLSYICRSQTSAPNIQIITL